MKITKVKEDMFVFPIVLPLFLLLKIFFATVSSKNVIVFLLNQCRILYREADVSFDKYTVCLNPTENNKRTK